MKTIYVLLFMTSLSVFSAAEQTGMKGNNVCKNRLSKKAQSRVTKQEQTSNNKGPALSAFNFFIINF